MATHRDDPYGAYNFEVTVNGISDDGTAVKGSFTEVTLADTEVTPIDYRNGSEDIRVRKLPGLKKFANITLKRGITGDLDFWNWIRTGMVGQLQRADGTITLLDENRQAVQRWHFTRGWCCKWTGPGFNATNNEIAMESVEICHEGLDTE